MWRHNQEIDVAALERVFEKFTIKQKSYKGKTQIRIMPPQIMPQYNAPKVMPPKAILSFQHVTETWR